MRKNKYGVAPKIARTSRDGIVFASKAELNRWEKLRLWQLAGEIRNLRRQVKYPLVIEGIHVGDYTPDFVYERKNFVPMADPGRAAGSGVLTLKQLEQHINPPLIDMGWIEVIEDVKGVMTTDAALRIKVFEVIHKKKVNIVKGK